MKRSAVSFLMFIGNILFKYYFFYLRIDHDIRVDCIRTCKYTRNYLPICKNIFGYNHSNERCNEIHF